MFLVSYMVQSPTSSTLSDLQTLQSAITQDIATLEANQGTTPDTTPVIPQQNVPQVTQGVPQQTQATSATITLDPNSPSGSVQAVNGVALKVPLITMDTTANAIGNILDEGIVITFSGAVPTEVDCDFSDGSSERSDGRIITNPLPATCVITSNDNGGVISIFADYTGITSTSTVSASIDFTKSDGESGAGSLPVVISGGVIQGNQITINP